MKLTIKVPASTSNLGPGFDCIGVALTLYNEFYFERSKQWEFIGFNEKYNNMDNLVYKAMERTYQYAKKVVTPYKITIIQCIPIARGLGSSSTCVVAGVLAANYFLDNIFSKKDVLNIATSLEGHPDNAAPAIFGNCVCSYIIDGEVKYVNYEINQNIQFTCAIPPFSLNTSLARSVLPKTLSYEDNIFNTSRAINIPHALMMGDLKLLYDLLDDKIHQPYRFPLIEESQNFIAFSKQNKIPFCISGSGSALLFITKDPIIHRLREISLTKRWEFIMLSVNKTGAIIDTIAT